MNEDAQTAGRAGTVLVFGHGDQQKAIISAIVVRALEQPGSARLSFDGVVAFSKSVKEHIRDIILPIVDRILSRLDISQKKYQISAVNPGAASSYDIGSKISGYSADVPIFLSLLSASLNIPVADDIVTTGHIASVEGDIRAVKALPAKIDAAISEQAVTGFICPDLEKDASLAALSPRERERSINAVMVAGNSVRMYTVSDISDVIKIVFAEEDIVLSSLKEGFYAVTIEIKEYRSPVENVLKFLTDRNRERFWNVLEHFFLRGNNNRGKELLSAFARYHIALQLYPSNFGNMMFQLILSLPPVIRRLKIDFPVLDTGLCAQLVQFAGVIDYKDICVLFEAAHGSHIEGKQKTSAAPLPEVSDTDCTAFDAVVAEINEQALAKECGISIDSARGSYILDSSTVASYDQFLDSVEAFYVHMCRHMKQEPVPAIDMKIARAEATDLVQRAFREKGGTEAAFAGARVGIDGGMRLVLDRLTEQLKYEMQTKHVQKILEEALDPLDWEDRVNFMRGALKRFSPFLSPDIKDQPPESFARHYEPIVRAYIKSLDSINRVLRTM